MKKNFCKKLLVGLLVLSFNTNVYANTIKYNTQVDMRTTKLATKKGTVIKVINQNTFKRILIKDNNNDTFAFNVYTNTPILNVDSFLYSPLEGTKVSVLYDESKPQTKTTPPQIEAEIIISELSDYKFIIDDFDITLLSSDKTKKLMVTSTTLVENQLTQKIDAETIKNSKLIVFYTSLSTDKRPNTVIARKIVKLDFPTFYQTKVINTYFNELNEQSLYTKGETKYVMLTDVCNKFKYLVSWNKEDKSIEIKKEGLIYNININEHSFKLNDTKVNFNLTPIIHNDKTFIPMDFAIDLAYKGTVYSSN